MLSLFVIAIAVTMARGKAPDCHCFGQLYSAPVGRSTLVRITALAGLAGFVLWQGRGDPGVSAVEWVGSFSLAERALLLVAGIVTAGMIAEGWFLFHLVQQTGRLLLRLDDLEAHLGTTGQMPVVPPPMGHSPQELPIGSVAPVFGLRDLEEGTVTLADLLAFGKPVFLVFSDSGCASCTALLPEIARWQHVCSRLTVAVIATWLLLVAAALADHLTTAPHLFVLTLYCTAFVTGGAISASQAHSDLRRRQVNAELVMVVAAIGAVSVNAWGEGTVLLALFSTSNALEHGAMERTHHAIRALMDLSPDTATVIRMNNESTVHINDLVIGDHALAHPGERSLSMAR